MKLDLLAFAAHPDDVELSCGGTIAKYIALGKKVGIVDFTKGELGTRGTPEIRVAEAEQAASIFGLATRENLGFADIYFKNDLEHQLEVVRMLRKYQPEVVLANSFVDRHPDHGRAAEMVEAAIFLSGLLKVETVVDGQAQSIWRPKATYHYIQSILVEPDIVEDVSNYWDKKYQAIWAFKSQFTKPDSKPEGPETFISSPEFLEMLDARGRVLGHSIGVKFGEGFVSRRKIGVSDLFSLL
jgi:bacillithiol biosynthesis deacetylase BshB1